MMHAFIFVKKKLFSRFTSSNSMYTIRLLQFSRPFKIPTLITQCSLELTSHKLRSRHIISLQLEHSISCTVLRVYYLLRIHCLDNTERPAPKMEINIVIMHRTSTSAA